MKDKYLKIFAEWQKKFNIFRDKSIEIYMTFKNEPTLNQATIIIDGVQTLVNRPDWIDHLNTSDIRNYFRKDNGLTLQQKDIQDKKLEIENLAREQIINTLKQHIEEWNKVPSIKILNSEYNLNVQKYFDSIDILLKETIARYPDLESKYLNESSFTEKYRKDLLWKIKHHKKFIVTTAVGGKKVDEKFFNSIKNYAERNKAMVLILPCQDAFSRYDEYNYDLDPKLKEFGIIYKTTKLNSNLFISDIKVSAKQIHPFTGLDRLTKDGSMIVASPKQEMKPVANSAEKLPKVMMSTGAITVCDYDNEKYMSKRLSALAEFDHILGAIIVEIEDNEYFHYRQVQAGPNGEIIDLGIEYTPDGTMNVVDGSVAIFGDSHVNCCDKDVVEWATEIVRELGCVEVILHDIFNATSITHHDKGKPIRKAIKCLNNNSSLKQEGEEVIKYLEKIKRYTNRVTVVKSNHDGALDRYIEEGRFIDDPENLYFALDLVKAYIEEKDPLKFMLEEKLGLKKNTINFLQLDKDYKVYGIECGFHGHLGANGSKGSLSIFAKGAGKVFAAHSHTPNIHRGVFQVGTFSELRLDYNHGMSSWMHAMGIIYPNGTRQLINLVKKPNSSITWRI